MAGRSVLRPLTSLNAYALERIRALYAPRQADGFEQRGKLYKLYHILNHYNMFGGGYYSQAVGIMQDLLR